MSSVQAGTITAVLGTQWGDEGKGKLVDILAADADLCCRFNGGSNAGHTLVVNGKKYAFHLLPCGMLYEKCENLLGNGVVIHIKTMMKEIDGIIGDFPDAIQRLKISTRAHLLFDFHRVVDGLTESKKAEVKSEGRGAVGAIGTTKQGIGPCYSSKASRLGVRVADLCQGDFSVFRNNYLTLLADYVARFPEELKDFDAEEEIARHQQYYETLKGCFVDGSTFIHDALKANKKVLVEGANAVMLDIDHGTYPFVTSSSTTAGGILTGLGVAPKKISTTYGVVKAYTTRVGGGPFASELEEGSTNCVHMQEVGFEYGTTTGRRRRCGWLDAQQLRYALEINGVDSINLTKLDVLTGIETLKILTKYVHPADQTDYHPYEFPAHWLDLAEVQTEFIELPGWTEDISACRSFNELPANCQAYVKKIEELTGTPISSIGVGPARDATIFVETTQTPAPKGLCC